MQTDTYKNTAYPRFSSFAAPNTPAGSKIGDASGNFDSLMSLVQKNAVTSEAGHVACAALISAWGSVLYAITGKAPTNG